MAQTESGYSLQFSGQEIDEILKNAKEVKEEFEKLKERFDNFYENGKIIHPVGYIFEWAPVSGQSVDLSTPQKVASYFGYGTWAAFAPGKVLAATNSSHAVGTSVGTETHTITNNEMPSHIHTLNGWQIGTQDFGGTTGLTVSAYPLTYNNTAQTTKATGGSAAMSLMQPTQYVYRWQRIA